MQNTPLFNLFHYQLKKSAIITIPQTKLNHIKKFTFLPCKIHLETNEWQCQKWTVSLIWIHNPITDMHNKPNKLKTPRESSDSEKQNLHKNHIFNCNNSLIQHSKYTIHHHSPIHTHTKKKNRPPKITNLKKIEN